MKNLQTDKYEVTHTKDDMITTWFRLFSLYHADKASGEELDFDGWWQANEAFYIDFYAVYGEYDDSSSFINNVLAILHYNNDKFHNRELYSSNVELLDSVMFDINVAISDLDRLEEGDV